MFDVSAVEFDEEILCFILLGPARSCENVSYSICEQQRYRSACAYTLSDQHLCCSLLR